MAVRTSRHGPWFARPHTSSSVAVATPNAPFVGYNFLDSLSSSLPLLSPTTVAGVWRGEEKIFEMPIADDMSRDSNSIYRQSNASRNVGRV